MVAGICDLQTMVSCSTQVPQVKMAIYRNRAFGHAGPSIWNALPNTLKCSSYCLCSHTLLLFILFSLSLFPGRGGRSPFQCIPRSPRVVVDQLQTDAFDELPGIGSRRVAVLCWACEVGDKWQVAGRSVNIGPRRFHHEKVATHSTSTLSLERI